MGSEVSDPQQGKGLLTSSISCSEPEHGFYFLVQEMNRGRRNLQLRRWRISSATARRAAFDLKNGAGITGGLRHLTLHLHLHHIVITEVVQP
ncbi:hypothetical protein C4D60_Mb08t13260 [Musa balbisiana]|uniref:Uncharacterized protein n=1 Tax=Musa balbisiana TaxID=52838 RepID=A0A4S8K3F5_MUSBA|nr:hypothetical protein C4D60_Mb08t13260 [Musa balbisiana]